MWEEPDDLQTKEGRGGKARISRAERFTEPTRKSSMWGVTGGREAELAAKQPTSDAPTALSLQTLGFKELSRKTLLLWQLQEEEAGHKVQAVCYSRVCFCRTHITSYTLCSFPKVISILRSSLIFLFYDHA